MSTDVQRQLAEYRAQIEAKYANAGKATQRELDRRNGLEKVSREQRMRKDRWLLVNSEGEICGVLVRHCAGSATEAFEQFYPRKRERLAAAAEGYRIEEDDAEGSRFEAYCEAMKAAGE